MFARYLRIDFLSHYGHQHYCPVSLLRVHGTNEYEKWKKEQAEISTPHNSQHVNEGNEQVKEIEDVQQQYKSHIQNTHNVATKIVKSNDIPIIKEHPFENDNDIHGYEQQQQNTEINDVKKTSIIITTATSSFIKNNFITQESIFKTIMKRLSLLESNSNLSKRYIEEQSKMINDIILMIELSKQHQYLTITNQFNETLDKLRSNYESMLASSLINLNKNQIQLDEELKDLYSKVHILINEVIFAKWLGLISVLLLTAYVVISQNWFNLKKSGKIPETIEQIRFPTFRSKHNLKNSRNLLIRPIRH
ncbi:11003_t:CDS:2 [Diversispora eburnea]|uniref:11003_t:CDS:1 n=1 Tax=Diversispora eburnea TaxID=1213867 RepID=A0A9N8W4F8_9GLOM|nr:11003_t:CDS:2 [Diversispora eburnea]